MFLSINYLDKLYMKQLSILLFLFSFTQAFAQKEEVKQELTHFVILDHQYNNEDFTDFSLDNGNYITLSLNKNDSCLANVTNEGQSEGEITRLTYESFEATEESNRIEHYTFRWSYRNTYDSLRGSCFIELIKSYRDKAVLYDLKMVDEYLNVSVYKGYIKGTLNLDNYIDSELEYNLPL